VVRYKYVGEQKISLLGTQYRYGEVVDLPTDPGNMNLRQSDWIRADLNPSQESSYKILRKIRGLSDEDAKLIAESYEDPYAIAKATKNGENLAGLELDKKVYLAIKKKFDRFNAEPEHTEEVIEEMEKQLKTNEG